MTEKPEPKPDDSYSDEETARRRDATVRAMIAMKPKPHKVAEKSKPKGRNRQTNERF